MPKNQDTKEAVRDYGKGYKAGQEYESPTDIIGTLVEALVPRSIPNEGKSGDFKEGFRDGQKDKGK